jgi:hypothetical protein
MAGINRAVMRSIVFLDARKSERTKPCIFLSHISIDKTTAIQIGDYIKDRGDIDIYLDVYDEELQRAVSAGDPNRITELIEKGLDNSTHIMCLLSNETLSSWWVPYELGFARRAKRGMATLLLKGTPDIPDYLKIAVLISGTRSLNQYLESIAFASQRSSLLESSYPSLLPYTASPHPLDLYLKWNA